MRLIKGFLTLNDYVSSPMSTLTGQKLGQTFYESKFEHDDLTILQVLIKYPKWEPEIPLFKYIRWQHLKQLKKDPKTFFIFDASTEGFSTIHVEPFFDLLYFNCKENKVDPEKVIFISSNMLDEQNIIRYNIERNIKKSIKVMTFNNFETMLFGVVGADQLINKNDDIDAQAEKRLIESKTDTKRLFRGKIFLSLSRVNRHHRTLSAYQLFNSKFFFDGLVSHGKFHKNTHWEQYTSDMPGDMTPKELKTFNKNVLPLTIDTEDFETNHAMFLNTHLHSQTLFQIVNETFTENWRGTSLFWSEKTFRSIFHMQPFIVFGQKGANKRLKDYGYKLFENLFDYSFDDEADTYKRWRMIFLQVEKLVEKLKTMSLEKQTRWKFQEREVLLHNYKTMLLESHTKQQFKDLSKYIRDKADGKTTNT